MKKHKRKGGHASLMSGHWKAMTDSVKADWRTPKSLIKLIKKKFGRIGLDPCASHIKKFQFADHNYTGKNIAYVDKKKVTDSGLVQSWRGFGLVYANVPYGKTHTTQWSEKAVQEFVLTPEKDDDKDELILLVPARTDTKWFQEILLPHVDAACFWKGRMVFGKKSVPKPTRCKPHNKKLCVPCSKRRDPAPFASLLVYFGYRPNWFKKVFTKYGWTIQQRSTR